MVRLFFRLSRINVHQIQRHNFFVSILSISQSVLFSQNGIKVLHCAEVEQEGDFFISFYDKTLRSCSISYSDECTLALNIDIWKPNVTIDFTWMSPNELCSTLEHIKLLSDRNKQLENDNAILQELVDRPEGAGAKFGYEALCKLLN